jgi:hypothetical protein
MSNPCFCGRAPRGFAWHDFTRAAWDRPPAVDACSIACLDIISRRKGVKPTVEEERAVEQASAKVGEYLEQIGKTDLAAMTSEEWTGFLAHAFTTIAAEVRLIAYEDTPF